MTVTETPSSSPNDGAQETAQRGSSQFKLEVKEAH